MPSVILINSFEVPVEREEEFLSHWTEAATVLERADGFISTRLHKSLDSSARFRFVNITEWSTPRHFQAAMKSDEFKSISAKLSFAANPSLYQVVVAIPEET